MLSLQSFVQTDVAYIAMKRLVTVNSTIKKKQREKQTEIIHEIKQLRFEKDRIRLFGETFSVRCTRQSRKVMWVVLNSLFFRELCKNEKRGHGGMFPGAKEKQQK